VPPFVPCGSRPFCLTSSHSIFLLRFLFRLSDSLSVLQLVPTQHDRECDQLPRKFLFHLVGTKRSYSVTPELRPSACLVPVPGNRRIRPAAQWSPPKFPPPFPPSSLSSLSQFRHRAMSYWHRAASFGVYLYRSPREEQVSVLLSDCWERKRSLTPKVLLASHVHSQNNVAAPACLKVFSSGHPFFFRSAVV